MWQEMAAGAGLGLGKSLLDQQQERRDREMAAAIAQWSPWTGMQVPMPKRTDYLGNVMQGGLAGASLGQGMDQQAAYENMQADQMKTNEAYRNSLAQQRYNPSVPQGAIVAPTSAPPQGQRWSSYAPNGRVYT